MKLLQEFVEETEFLKEDVEGKKSYMISGPFMIADAVNGNGRSYPRTVLEKEVNNFQQVINEKRALGELNHPVSSPTMNLDRASHLITELNMKENKVYGKAKILDTPMGKIAKTFIDEGVRLGVSSRGVGSIRESNGMKLVQPDFKLITVDLVSTPSGPGCFVEALVENVEWIFDGVEWKSQRIDEIKHVSNKKEREELFLKEFANLFR